MSVLGVGHGPESSSGPALGTNLGLVLVAPVIIAGAVG
jgi:hypothetical protein